MLITGFILGYFGVGAALTYQKLRIDPNPESAHVLWRVLFYPGSTLWGRQIDFVEIRPETTGWPLVLFWLSSTALWPARIVWLIVNVLVVGLFHLLRWCFPIMQ